MFQEKVKHGYVATFDDQDRILFESKTWNLMQSKQQFMRGDTGYLSGVARDQASGKYRTVTFHGLIFPAPKGMQVDHINGDKLDNRRCNLRHVTHVQNSRAFRLPQLSKTSHYRGVYLNKKSMKWVAQIGIKRKAHRIGHFNSQEEAAAAYNERARAIGFSESALNKIAEKSTDCINSNHG